MKKAAEADRRTNKGYLRAFLAKDLAAGKISNESVYIRFAAQRGIVDSEVFSTVQSDNLTRMFGDPGAGFLVDTGRCYHMGSRVGQGKRRLMFTACYVSRPAIYPDFLNRISISAPLTRAEQLLLQP